MYVCMYLLSPIIDLSIRCGYFPDEWKISKLLPLYKEDIKSDPNNCRPISILPVVSKIIEKVIFKQLYEYLTHKNLLAGSQNGFRPVHSSLTALLETTNNWYLNIDDGLIIKGVLFLDREKVFDTVNHNILLKNLMCNFMVSTCMQFISSNHNNQIAFRVIM